MHIYIYIICICLHMCTDMYICIHIRLCMCVCVCCDILLEPFFYANLKVRLKLMMRFVEVGTTFTLRLVCRLIVAL